MGREQQQIDVGAVEELFGQSDCQSKAKATPTRTGANRRSFREPREEVCVFGCVCVFVSVTLLLKVCQFLKTIVFLLHVLPQVLILDSKRGMNLEIFLKQFRR